MQVEQAHGFDSVRDGVVRALRGPGEEDGGEVVLAPDAKRKESDEGEEMEMEME